MRRPLALRPRLTTGLPFAVWTELSTWGTPIFNPSRSDICRSDERPGRVRLGRVDLAALDRERDGVRAGGGAELRHGVPHVRADGLRGEEELLCGLLARQALREQAHDLALARGQRLRPSVPLLAENGREPR